MTIFVAVSNTHATVQIVPDVYTFAATGNVRHVHSSLGSTSDFTEIDRVESGHVAHIRRLFDDMVTA
jgi:hypothetical protein